MSEFYSTEKFKVIKVDMLNTGDCYSPVIQRIS